METLGEEETLAMCTSRVLRGTEMAIASGSADGCGWERYDGDLDWMGIARGAERRLLVRLLSSSAASSMSSVSGWKVIKPEGRSGMA